MRLICRSFVIAAIASTACHDASAPVQPVNYALATIDARPLPTYVFSASEGPTVLSGSFILDGRHATANERRRDTSGTEYEFNVRYRYTITGSDIRFSFDPPCGGPAADCASPPTGTISGDHLLINYGAAISPTIYDYQHIVQIDLPPG